jgi:hypothetical protein
VASAACGSVVASAKLFSLLDVPHKFVAPPGLFHPRNDAKPSAMLKNH